MTPEEGGRKKPCTKDMQLVRQIKILNLICENSKNQTISYPQVCFSKTWDCAAFVELEGKEMAMPGEDATMSLK